jgi:hypothetical protein
MASASALLLLGSALPSMADDASSDVPTIAAKAPVTVNVPVTTESSPGRDGANGIISIRLGASAPMRVIVDTGFSGLLLFPGALAAKPGGVTIGKTKSSVIVPDGSKVPGVMGQAKMSVNGVQTVVPISLMQATGTTPYLTAWRAQGVSGLLGLGTKGGSTMVNPFTTLPGSLGTHWSIHFSRDTGRSGSIVLGALRPTDATMNFSLDYLGQDVNGAPLWNDQAANGCWKFGTMPQMCVPTQFDAAFNLMRAKGGVFRPLGTDSKGYLRPGMPVRLAAPGSAFDGYSLLSGSQASRNLIKVMPIGAAKVITSNGLYFDNVVTYDLVTGTVSMVKVTGESKR